MLTFKELKWDNCFSYADNNSIRFDENPLTQLTGTNGAGKTSISLLIQEALYGKNSKNIKKQDIVNNKTGKKGYSIQLHFTKNEDEYLVDLNRLSSLKFKLYKNGEDISSHTALNTYKTLAEIIGVADFKVFCQLIYQHSTDSLDFLTATDTNRKKFLINLLQLEKYIEYHEHFKDKLRDVNSGITSLSGSISTIESWIAKHQDMELIKKDYLKKPEEPTEQRSRLQKIKEDITNINNINLKIGTNNEYKAQLNALDPTYYMGSAPAQPNPSSQELRVSIQSSTNEKTKLENKLRELKSLPPVCPKCGQPTKSTEDYEKEVGKEIFELNNKVEHLGGKLIEVVDIEKEINRYSKEQEQFEQLNRLIDNSIATKSLDINELRTEERQLEIEISTIRKEIQEVEKQNTKISEHNSRVEVVKDQLKSMKEDLDNKDIELVEKENLAHILDLLKRTFGTNGLVSYKIESSVKELEKKINQYLSELTHFQIYFKLQDEKLNIEVVDDLGNVTSMTNLSSGEKARVNIATILAIRNILSSLTSTKINLLFLDEVIGVIDAEGKEKLSEILLQENLNTFIVSHDWEHPLIPRIRIIKEHNISRIEND